MKGSRTKRLAQKFQTLKIRPSTRKKLDVLLAHVSQYGWRVVEADRQDAPSLADVVDAAADALKNRLHVPTKDDWDGGVWDRERR